MKLLGPEFFSVELAEKEHHAGLELLSVQRGNFASGARAVEDARGIGIGAIGVGEDGDAVVREPPAERVEGIVALPERVEKVGEAVAIDPRCRG